MRGRREYVDYVRDVLDAIEKIERFAAGLNYAEFAADEKTVFAVIRAFEIIGEATKKIPKPIRDQNPNLPWQRMAGIRDRLIHEYFGVDLAVVWATVQEDLPKLKPALEQLLATFAQGDVDPSGTP